VALSCAFAYICGIWLPILGERGPDPFPDQGHWEAYKPVSIPRLRPRDVETSWVIVTIMSLLRTALTFQVRKRV